ncbi:hypothetical protein BG005_011846 [Podila minutissima]|nr:hypothetical protein BG005_011846 [Podila minutissima]
MYGLNDHQRHGRCKRKTSVDPSMLQDEKELEEMARGITHLYGNVYLITVAHRGMSRLGIPSTVQQELLEFSPRARMIDGEVKYHDLFTKTYNLPGVESVRTELIRLLDSDDPPFGPPPSRNCSTCQIEQTRDNSFVTESSLRDTPLVFMSNCIGCMNALSLKYSRTPIGYMKNWYKFRREFFMSLKQAMGTVATVIAQGYCKGTPSYTDQELAHLLELVTTCSPTCFYCWNTLKVGPGRDASAEYVFSTDRVVFVSVGEGRPEKSLPFHGNRSLKQRSQYLNEVEHARPFALEFGKKVIAKLDPNRSLSQLTSEDLERFQELFNRHLSSKQSSGHLYRVKWSLREFIIFVLGHEGRSAVTGLPLYSDPKSPTMPSFDRVFNDLHYALTPRNCVLIMELSINWSKAHVNKYKICPKDVEDPAAYALEMMQADIGALLDVTKDHRDHWQQQVDDLVKTPFAWMTSFVDVFPRQPISDSSHRSCSESGSNSDTTCSQAQQPISESLHDSNGDGDNPDLACSPRQDSGLAGYGTATLGGDFGTGYVAQDMPDLLEQEHNPSTNEEIEKLMTELIDFEAKLDRLQKQYMGVSDDAGGCHGSNDSYVSSDESTSNGMSVDMDGQDEISTHAAMEDLPPNAKNEAISGVPRQIEGSEVPNDEDIPSSSDDLYVPSWNGISIDTDDQDNISTHAAMEDLPPNAKNEAISRVPRQIEDLEVTNDGCIPSSSDDSYVPSWNGFSVDTDDQDNISTHATPEALRTNARNEAISEVLRWIEGLEVPNEAYLPSSSDDSYVPSWNGFSGHMNDQDNISTHAAMEDLLPNAKNEAISKVPKWIDRLEPPKEAYTPSSSDDSYVPSWNGFSGHMDDQDNISTHAAIEDLPPNAKNGAISEVPRWIDGLEPPNEACVPSSFTMHVDVLPEENDCCAPAIPQPDGRQHTPLQYTNPLRLLELRVTFSSNNNHPASPEPIGQGSLAPEIGSSNDQGWPVSFNATVESRVETDDSDGSDTPPWWSLRSWFGHC